MFGFGPKIVCEQCGKKAKEADAIYFRGSQFCTPACVGTWKAANPGPVARGEPAKLQDELRMLLDEAYTEAHRTFGPMNIPGFVLKVGNNTTVSVGFGGATDNFGQTGGGLANMDAAYQQEQAQEARMQFQTHVLRSAPILRALGFAAEADQIDGHDFAKHDRNALLQALGRVRQGL